MYFISQSHKNSRIYIPLTLRKLTNYDFNRTGEVNTFILKCLDTRNLWNKYHFWDQTYEKRRLVLLFPPLLLISIGSLFVPVICISVTYISHIFWACWRPISRHVCFLYSVKLAWRIWRLLAFVCSESYGTFSRYFSRLNKSTRKTFFIRLRPSLRDTS